MIYLLLKFLSSFWYRDTWKSHNLDARRAEFKELIKKYRGQ